MLTAAPLLAVTLGECEKKCCRRGEKAHACCKRGGAGAPGLRSTREGRCAGGHANQGLARLEALAAARLAVGVGRVADDGGALVVATPEASPVVAEHSPFSQRPPPIAS
jgi:hypothetical protein